MTWYDSVTEADEPALCWCKQGYVGHSEEHLKMGGRKDWSPGVRSVKCSCCKLEVQGTVFFDTAVTPMQPYCRPCKDDYYGHDHEDGSPTFADMEMGALNKSERVERRSRHE